ncbi:hypothetical protein [Clostridium sp. LP20]|uniref:hypothetical protein n=1 Tax=Clostridium sp. LP20 TaxID=3418665 RepID=UPI003EE68090
MKKVIFGGILFIGGLLGLLIYPITAAFSREEISRLGGSLANDGGIVIVGIIFGAISLTGLAICINEVYVKK